MQREKIQTAASIATLFFGLNTVLPFVAFAQSSDPATVGQQIQIVSPALTTACTLGNITLDPVEIQTASSHYSYYINPKNAPSADLQNCGSDLTVEDTRYNGGFTLQVTATEYVSQSEPTDKITIDNLSIVTEQLATSYTEDNTGASAFSGTPNTLVTGTQETSDSEAEGAYELPFDFTFYSTTYPSGTAIYLCTNGTINFSSGDCNNLPADLEDIVEDPAPRILPYFKDLTTNTNVNATFGVYYDEPNATTARFRWKAAPVSDTADIVQFEVVIADSGTEDTITFNYGDGTEITDGAVGPVIGITKGGPSGIPVSATYTLSTLSEKVAGDNLANLQAIFSGGFDFTEVKQPGTSAVSAVLSGNPSNDGNPANDNDYVSFIEDSNGTSLPQEILDGHVDASCGGRIGVYTVYPSYRLVVPANTADGTYQNTITYTLMDSTDPSC